jgi:hypothetical protein
MMPKLDLVNWTMRATKQLRPEHHMRSDIEDPSAASSILLGVLEGERGEPSSEGIQAANFHSVQLTEDPIASPPSEPADGQASSMSPLLKAIVEPDIYTAPADRERAITLRWVLRDIKANRLKLSPVSQHDLQDLIDLGLVEMRDDAPVLTNAGINAIV